MAKIPGVNHLDAVRALEKAGFVVVRQGKHIVMSNGGFDDIHQKLLAALDRKSSRA